MDLRVPIFTGEEMETRRNKVTCLRSGSKKNKKLNPRVFFLHAFQTPCEDTYFLPSSPMNDKCTHVREGEELGLFGMAKPSCYVSLKFAPFSPPPLCPLVQAILLLDHAPTSSGVPILTLLPTPIHFPSAVRMICSLISA